MNTGGGVRADTMARTRVPVACVRLSRIAAFRAAVHRPPAIDTPARLTTALASLRADVHGPVLSAGDQRISWSCVGWRVSTTTAWPSWRSAWARAVPSRPVPPAMRMVDIVFRAFDVSVAAGLQTRRQTGGVITASLTGLRQSFGGPPEPQRRRKTGRDVIVKQVFQSTV